MPTAGQFRLNYGIGVLRGDVHAPYLKTGGLRCELNLRRCDEPL